MNETLLAIIIICLFILIYAMIGLRIIRPNEKGIVERLGSFNRELGPGLNFIKPFFETMKKVDLREQVSDVPPQEVITQDNVVVTVDAVIYYQITDPKKVLYNVSNFNIAVTKLAQTSLRNIMGDMTLDNCLTSRESINKTLRQILDDATDIWGVRVTRVEIQRVDPPRDVVEAMHQQMRAERTKRAAILEAEGVKASDILRAEGSRKSAILSSEGKAEATRKVAAAEKDREVFQAEGHARAIELVYKAIHEGRPTSDLLGIKYLEALEKMAEGESNKIFIPYEASAALSAVGSLGDVFKDIKKGKKTSEKE